MKFVPYSDIEKQKWDKFVLDSPDGWLYHTSGYIDFRISKGEKNVSFAVMSDAGGEILALCVLYETERQYHSNNPLLRLIQKVINTALRAVGKNSPFMLRKLYCSDSFGGPVLSAQLKDKGRRKMLNMVMVRIDEIAKERAIDQLELRLADNAPQYLPPLKKDHNPLWQVGCFEYLSLPPRLVLILDLRKSEEELKKDMDEDCRSEINKAAKNGIVFCHDCDDIKEYHDIHRTSWSRTFGSYLPLKHFEDMVAYLGGDKIKLFFAEYKEKKVSAILLHLYKDSVLYWGGCSLEEGLSLRVNNFLLWSAILWAKANGIKWFEIGLFQAYPGVNKKEYSVGKYKAQFSNNYYPALEGKKNYTWKARNLENNVGNSLFRHYKRLRDNIPLSSGAM